MPAPIALFVYNRPGHARRTVDALRANPLAAGSELFVFADAAKDPQAGDAVAQTRQFARSIEGFRSVTLIERERNLGLAANITDGISGLAARFGRVIAMEDDLVSSPHFLRYMNDALDMYAGDDRVMHVSGSAYPVGGDLRRSSYFLRVPLCWGWGTWQRAWVHFSRDTGMMDRFSRDMIRRFDFDDSYDYWEQLELNRRGRLDTWFAFWYATLTLRNGLALFPGTPLVKNIGMDGSGVHCTATDQYDVEVGMLPMRLERIAIEECAEAFELHKAYFKRIRPQRRRLLAWLARSLRGESQ